MNSSHRTSSTAYKMFDAVLVLTALAGGYLAVRAGMDQRPIVNEITRLRSLTSELPVTDPNKVYIQANPGLEELSWSWKAHIPSGVQFGQLIRYGHGSMSNSGGHHTDNFVDFFARLKISDQGDGQLYYRSSGSSGLTHFGENELFQWIREHPEALVVEVYAENDSVECDVSKTIRLLTLKVAPEFIDRLPAHARQHMSQLGKGVIMTYDIGTNAELGKLSQ